MPHFSLIQRSQNSINCSQPNLYLVGDRIVHPAHAMEYEIISDHEKYNNGA